MNKKLIRLTEQDLNRIVKESVRKTLYESVDPSLDELAKEMNFYHSEAMQNLQGLLKTYNKLPEEYSSMKNSNVATIRSAIKSLELVFKGKEWRDVPMM